MIELIKKANIDFISRRKTFILASVIVIAVGLVSLIIKGGPLFSIDFEGGTLIQVRFEQGTQVENIRNQLSAIGYGDATIQTFGAENEFLVRVKTSTKSETQIAELRAAFASINGANDYEIRRLETVGPKIGKELRGDALMAVLVAMLGIVVYISFRFKFVFAMGALAALAHDVLITLGLFSVLNIEVSLTVIAAFLFIVGYSLNDTIVVYDRIRENVKTKRRDKFMNIINASINDTLNRTVITSLTTIMVALVLFFIGGEVIKPFSIALIIGLVVGTYSSIFIASPILIAYEDRLVEKQ